MRLQVTTRSVLGAVAYETGGILVDAGRIRLFGAGSERSLLTVNEAIDGFGDVVFVADDVLGGIFALNGGRFGPADLGQIFHLAADSVAWSCLDIGYADFVAWCLTGDRDALYDRFARLPASGSLRLPSRWLGRSTRSSGRKRRGLRRRRRGSCRRMRLCGSGLSSPVSRSSRMAPKPAAPVTSPFQPAAPARSGLRAAPAPRR